jgi:hypothetical protein
MTYALQYKSLPGDPANPSGEASAPLNLSWLNRSVREFRVVEGLKDGLLVGEFALDRPHPLR